MPSKRVRAQKKKRSESPPESSGDEWDSDSKRPAKKARTAPNAKKAEATKAVAPKTTGNDTRKVPSSEQPRRLSIKEYRTGPRADPAFYRYNRRPDRPAFIIPQTEPPVLKSEEIWNDHVPLSAPRHLEGKLGDIVVPDIYFGNMAPTPRWYVMPERGPPRPSQPSSNGNSKRSSVASTSSSSSTSTPKIQSWIWVFEAGEFGSWKRLEYDQLYEYAYLCLYQALQDPSQQERIRHAVHGPFNGPMQPPHQLLPSLPGRPLTGYFVLDQKWTSILEKPPGLRDSFYYFPDYKRPTLAVRPDPTGHNTANTHVIPRTMFNLMHKSLSRKPAVSREQSVSPTSHAGSGIRGSQALEDPEKTDPGKDRDLERNDEGKIARLDAASMKVNPSREESPDCLFSESESEEE
ncbi:hypothetical protein PENARI_c008G11377 [Penicillium arizonense]|uniref:Uncharacterized protein n=1 Tax=Penicillium arizonense TaxID=1835702 RepID=A0A1F5LJA8_PENAI|nr:hypothetical protein PENARI_c008G11377 [Penicillium arizonense]OGE53298.1 hypothetical protein PENARI_c008G11377 [Penicillium arizonense]